MTRATGGSAWAATSTRSRFFAVRVLASLVRRLDPELLAVLADQPDARDANRVVDARLRLGTARRLEPGTPARPQMLFTKLVLTSSYEWKNRWHAAAEGLINLLDRALG